MPVRDEGFCDRAYNADGTLMDRALPGAVYDDPGLAATQALALADRVDTLCLHGDSPGALAMATAVRHALDHGRHHRRGPGAPTLRRYTACGRARCRWERFAASVTTRCSSGCEMPWRPGR